MLINNPVTENNLQETIHFFKSEGTMATAKVLAIANTNKRIHHLNVLSIYVEIHGPDIQRFHLNTFTTVEKHLIPKIGNYCRIYYHPEVCDAILILEIL